MRNVNVLLDLGTSQQIKFTITAQKYPPTLSRSFITYRWQELLQSQDSTHENPLKRLILQFPSSAKVVFDRCVQRSEKDSSAYRITYDFQLLDPGPDGPLGPSGEKFCGLETMVEGKQKELLLHPLSRTLLKVTIHLET